MSKVTNDKREERQTPKVTKMSTKTMKSGTVTPHVRKQSELNEINRASFCSSDQSIYSYAALMRAITQIDP